MGYELGSTRKGLVLAKKSVAATLAKLKHIPEEAFVNAHLKDMYYIDRLKNWLGMPKWKGWDKIKQDLRIIGFHTALSGMENLYQVIALTEKHNLLGQNAAEFTNFDEAKKEELRRQGS